MLDKLTALIARLRKRQELKRLRELLAPYYERLRARYAGLRARYAGLEPREKLLVRIGAVLLGAMLAYNLIYLPAGSLSERLRMRVEARKREVAETERLAAAYAGLKGELAAAEKNTVLKRPDFSLFSVLEALLSKQLPREKIGSLTPSERKISEQLVQYTVELKLNGVSLSQIVDTLYSLRTWPQPVLVSNLHIKPRSQDPHSYDVDMTCVALARAG